MVEERLEVAEFLIEQMADRPAGVQVDLRTYVEHALPAYRQWLDGRMQGNTSWQDVVQAKIMGGPRIQSRESRIERDRRLACQVFHEGQNEESRLNLWKERTRLGKTAFHERLREARESGLFDEMNEVVDVV